MLWLAPLGCAVRDKQLRVLLGVHVFLNGSVARRAEALEDKQDLVALDQPARLLDRFGRTIGVVIRDEADLATVDAALSVHLVEISGDRFPDHPVGRCRTAVGIVAVIQAGTEQYGGKRISSAVLSTKPRTCKCLVGPVESQGAALAAAFNAGPLPTGLPGRQRRAIARTARPCLAGSAEVQRDAVRIGPQIVALLRSWRVPAAHRADADGISNGGGSV